LIGLNLLHIDFFWRRIHQIAGFVEMGDAQIKVIVKYGAQNINVEVPATGKVEDLMQQLQLHTQLLPRLQKLICKGKVLKGDMSLKTAQLTDGAKVMLMAAQGFQPRFPTKQSTLPSKQAHSTATLTLSLDETRVKAWKLTGIVSLRDSSLQVVPPPSSSSSHFAGERKFLK
jgi:hypothetical protein